MRSVDAGRPRRRPDGRPGPGPDRQPRPKAKAKAQTEAKSQAQEVARGRGRTRISNSPHPTYDNDTARRISAAMLSYSTLEVRGGWPTLPADVTKLAPGASGPEVALLRERLAITDDLAPEHAGGDVFDANLTAAIRRFQSRHGLEETGTIGQRTLAALNVPVTRRLRQLAASLDRLSAMDFTFGHRYVVVNIPAAVAEAVENGRVVRRHAAIVGKPDRPSPTLTTSLTAVNLNPTWTVPLGILKKDIRTKMRRDPGYVARMHMRVLDGSGREIDPGSVNWQFRRRAELHRPAGFRHLERARRAALRHAESAFGLSARHQQPLAVQRRLPLPVVGLRAHREPARPRGLAAAGAERLEPRADRRRDRDRAAAGHPPDPQGAGGVGLSHRLGDRRQRRAFPRRHLQPRRRALARAGRGPALAA